MIHSTGSMPTGNFDEPVTSLPRQAVPHKRFRFPAEYYSAPLSEVKPVFPQWVPWGCGGVAALFLLLLFAGGSMLTGSRLNALVDLTLGMSIGEVKGIYGGDVTAAQKTAFDAEVTAMRRNLRESKISVQNVQPFLKAMQKAVADEKVSGPEVEELTKLARDAARPKPSTVNR